MVADRARSDDTETPPRRYRPSTVPTDEAAIVGDRIASCRNGTNPTALGRMPSGWAVLGDDQFLPGYSLLLADPEAEHLTDLEPPARAQFLLDMSLLGQAILATTSCARVNYVILGNTDPALHAHVWARYADEPNAQRRGPVWRYPREVRTSTPFSPEAHGPLRQALREEVELLLRATPAQ
jgi:diadenosine tetraphosphate (Ap4A) HIT family hydrolase